MIRTAAALPLLLLLLLPGSGLCQTPRILIDEPAAGATTRSAVALSGRVVDGAGIHHVTILHNGLSRRVPLFDGRFSAEVALFRGTNQLRLVARSAGGVATRELTLWGRFAPPALEVRLTWGPRSDLDLFVREPGGRIVTYADPRHRGARFEGEVRDGQGPEIYRATRLVAGRYRLGVRKMAGSDQVPVRALLEATWRAGGVERKAFWRLTLGKPGLVERELVIREPGR